MSCCSCWAASCAARTAATTRSPSVSTSSGSTAFGSMVTLTISPVPVTVALTSPPPALPSTSAVGQLGLRRLHLRLQLLGLLHQLLDVGLGPIGMARRWLAIAAAYVCGARSAGLPLVDDLRAEGLHGDRDRILRPGRARRRRPDRPPTRARGRLGSAGPRPRRGDASGGSSTAPLEGDFWTTVIFHVPPNRSPSASRSRVSAVPDFWKLRRVARR